MVTVNSKQAFKEGLLSGEDEIRVEDPQLAKWVVVIHGIKQTLWGIAIVIVAAGLYVLLATGGVGAPEAGVAGLAATGVVGVSGATAMVGLGIALGGIAALKTVREKYKIADKGPGYVLLRKK